MSAQKKIVIIAGPNGAGKTSFAREFLPFEAGCPLFFNADMTAAGLSPFQPDADMKAAPKPCCEQLNGRAKLPGKPIRHWRRYATVGWSRSM